MANWTDLDHELWLWRDMGCIPTLWWRDDDAQKPTPDLDRLLGISDRHEVPVHLAVIPEGMSPDLVPRLDRAVQAYVLQHGFAHINHEPKGMGASEVGVNRRLELQKRDLLQGWQQLENAGLSNLLRGLVPPWNRMDAATLPHLPEMGYQLFSAYDGHTPRADVTGLLQINGQVDPIRWKHGASFRGVATALDLLIAHLVARRTGQVSNDQPTGLITHHLQTDAETWDFVDTLIARSLAQGARWISLSSLLKSD